MKYSNSILTVIALGIWFLFLQNAGVIYTPPVKSSLTNEYIKADPEQIQKIEIVGINVIGSNGLNKNSLPVDLTEINGYRNCFFANKNHEGSYYSIPVVIW